jgi:hypothetical protein
VESRQARERVAAGHRDETEQVGEEGGTRRGLTAERAPRGG